MAIYRTQRTPQNYILLGALVNVSQWNIEEKLSYFPQFSIDVVQVMGYPRVNPG